jgi:peptide deformylase
MRIVEYPHPALLHPTALVPGVDGSLRRHVGEMFEAMYRAEGVGLAANQVALPYRLVIMNLDLERKEKETEEVFINPTIVEQKGSVEDDEGCLSFPGLYAKIRRSKEVIVEAYDLSGQKIRRRAKGMEARAWQHEIDHLDGKVFIDRFSTLAKLAHRGEVRSFERRFREAQKAGRVPADADIERTMNALREAIGQMG